MLDCCSLEAQENGYHHHAKPQAKGSPHHRAPSTDTVHEEGREEAADDKHDLNAASDNEREVLAEADVTVENSGYEVARILVSDGWT